MFFLVVLGSLHSLRDLEVGNSFTFGAPPGVISFGSVSEHAERMREPYLHYQSEAAPVGRETSSRSLICICEALFFRAAWQSFAGSLK